MGKRGATLVRRKNDAYDTPAHAVEPLLAHLDPAMKFIEPCAGKGDLARYLYSKGHRPRLLFDIKPRATHMGLPGNVGMLSTFEIHRGNAATFRLSDAASDAERFITNPPWTWELLVPIILNLYWQAPTWLLLSADLIHNERFSPFEPICRDIVSVGRVRWMEGHESDKGHAPYDNAAWYLFDGQGRHPIIHGRR